MKGFEDPYKSVGIVQLKIEKLSQFAQGELNSLRQSDAIYVRGFQWKIMAKNMEKHCDNQVELQQKVLGYYIECSEEPSKHPIFGARFLPIPAWSCTCSATLKVLAQKEGQEDYAEKFSYVFNPKYKRWGLSEFMTFEALMNPELGWYDEATDSIILQAHIKADAPHGVKNMLVPVPDDVYTKYTMRSEHSLFLELNDCSNCNISRISMPIEDKLWSFKYSPDQKELELKMQMHRSDASKITAECIFWYWKDKEIAILQKSIPTFYDMPRCLIDSRMKSFYIAVPTNGATPANNKFSVVIRLLDEQISSGANSLQSYFGNYEGVDTVTLCIRGYNSEEASFIVPKYVLTQASPVFQRMLASEMTEKSTGKVEIEDTNAEEFGDFLKAISPKQEHPNPSNVFALVKLAHLYQFQSLLDRCELHLMNCVEIPLIHRLTCANFYGLKKLKNHLKVSLEGTGLFKLVQQTELYLDVLDELAKEIE